MKTMLLFAVAALALGCSHKTGKAPSASANAGAAPAKAAASGGQAHAGALDAAARSGAKPSASAGSATGAARSDAASQKGAAASAHAASQKGAAPSAHAALEKGAAPTKATAAHAGGHEQRNLKVLPHSWSKHKLVAYMKHEVSRGLGVKCNFCHVKGDKASDKLKPKRTARHMMAMTRALNHRFFRGKNRITCGTCHHGAKKPTK